MDRITLVGLNSSVINNNQKTLARLATYQEQLATGKKLNRISDDVVAARQSLRYRADENASGKYLDNIDKSLAYMGATDTSLAEITQLFDEVKSIAVQGANASQDQASRYALSQQVDSFLTRLVDVANTVHDGRFIFGGTATTEGKPFALAEDGSRVDYAGNLDAFTVQVGPNASVAVNQDGYSLFKENVDVFDAMIQLRDALKANDAPQVAKLIDTVDAAQRHANDLQGSMGGRIQRLELSRTQLESSRIYQKELISKAEDADFTEVISKMQLTQVALEAGLQSAARTITPSLLDFLG
ncbi:MAG: flagellar hook-associated protein FlgL [Planctomycetes bacterium]|nr:flagellar hook-associated protein FlgL [Planctomycetota bacterium]